MNDHESKCNSPVVLCQRLHMALDSAVRIYIVDEIEFLYEGRKLEESPTRGRDAVVLQKDWLRRNHMRIKTWAFKSKLTIGSES